MDRATCRIIDANFNRAREACRVMEEYCRFALDCDSLTGRAKGLRHELSAAIGGLDQGRLIASRDTTGDVGVGMTVKGQLKRRDLPDAVTAACKRLPEALRALTETIAAFDPDLAASVEALRYQSYTLEKDIVLLAEPAEKFRRVRLYVLITADECEQVQSLTQACAAGGADCIQLRAKKSADVELIELARGFVATCRQAGVLSIINDRADIAIASGADGVHLGLEDISPADARKLQLAPLIVGRTTHSLAELGAAIEEMPTYVSLGPVYATSTKPGLQRAGIEYVSSAMERLEGSGVAHVAIGGITADNIGEVLAAGVRAVAVCAAATDTADPESACRQLKQKLSSPQGGDG